jgi:hypothetical protein
MIKHSALVEFVCDIKGRNLIEIYQIAQIHFPNSKIEWFNKNHGLRIDNHEIGFIDGKCKIEYNKKI